MVTILAPELSRCHPQIDPFNYNDGKGSLWFAHVDIDAVHPDRLASGGTHSCDDAGVCSFEPTRDISQLDCVP